MSAPKVILLDLDGTVRDTSSIAHLITQAPKRYDEFSTRAGHCPPVPRIVSVVRQRFYTPEWLVIVATGQKERHRETHERWMLENVGPFHWMSMRQNDDHRPAHETKREMVWRLRAHDYNVVEAWDDDPLVIAMYNSEGLDTHWVYNETRAS